MAENQQYCTFYVDGHFFGVEVMKVQEVLRYQKMTRVPLAPDEVRGLINLRGHIVTAIDMRRRLKFKECPRDQVPMNVVVRSEDGAVSLLVDEIGDVLEVDDNTFERPPETVDSVARELVRGVYKLPHKLLLVLDSEKVVNLANNNGTMRDQSEHEYQTSRVV